MLFTGFIAWLMAHLNTPQFEGSRHGSRRRDEQDEDGSRDGPADPMTRGC